jgi:hypothetical protein
MNTANLQLEGLYVAVSALMNALREKGVLTQEEIEASLADAEGRVASDPGRPLEMSPAHVDAILFPLRYLRLANRTWAADEVPGFMALAARVGREKPPHGEGIAQEREDIEVSEDADVRRIEEEDRDSGKP